MPAINSPSYDFCVKVQFPNDNAMDYLLLKKNKLFEYNYLFEGKLKKEGVEVDLILPDPDEVDPDDPNVKEEYTIVRNFQSYPFPINIKYNKHDIEKYVNSYVIILYIFSGS